jgi:hypothetical protein
VLASKSTGLNTFINGKVTKLFTGGTEKDVIHRFWRQMDLFFEDKLDTTRGDKQSNASSIRINRSVYRDDNKLRAIKPDIKFEKENYEYSAGESKYGGVRWNENLLVLDNVLKRPRH